MNLDISHVSWFLSHIILSCRERALRVSVQDPTYILIEADGDSFGLVAYGIKAETKYMQLDTEEQNKFHYLTQFKGQIHDKEVFWGKQ